MMWKPSKLVLLLLIIIMVSTAGIAFAFVDWELVKTGKGVFRELELPVLCLFLSLNLIFPYVKKLKEEKGK